MTLRAFIQNNRQPLETYIRQQIKRPDHQISQEECRLWILNDEGLYLWARREGCRI